MTPAEIMRLLERIRGLFAQQKWAKFLEDYDCLSLDDDRDRLVLANALATYCQELTCD